MRILWVKMGGRVFANGHSYLGTSQSIHSAYAAVPEYEAAMTAAYGAARAREILSWAPQNMILYPSLALKASPQTMRVIRPLAPDRTLVEAWAFRAEVDAVAVEDAKPQRYALLHLFYPDTFEAIVSPPHRERIVSYFAGQGAIEPTGDDDRDLLAIRAAITPQYGEGFDFYASRLRPLWEQGSDPWAPVVRWAAKLATSKHLDEEERDYKLQAVEGFGAWRRRWTRKRLLPRRAKRKRSPSAAKAFRLKRGRSLSQLDSAAVGSPESGRDS